MQLPLLRIMFFLVWSVDVFTQRHDHKIRSNVISRSYVHNLNYKELSKSTRRWHRANRRVINSMDISEEHATGVSAKNALNTLINKKNSTSCLMKRNTMDKAKRIRFKYANSLNGTETALVNSPGHKMEKLNPEMPAAMETLGDACNSSKPPLVSKRGAHKMNHRDKRGTIDDQKKAVKRGRRKLRKNSHHSLQLETLVENPRTMWEPMPRPLALNQSLDFSLEMTRSYELFTLPDEYQRETTPQTPDMREKTHEDKNPFYPLRSASYRAYAILCVSIVIFTLGLLGNISIMCIVCHNYYMRSISNSLLANLAIWDFLIIIFCLPLVIFHELTKNWLLGEFSCRIIPYIEVASLGVTTFTLCALCIDRFRAATNVQMYYEMIENCASTTAKLAVIWVGALLLALPELLIRQLVTEEEESPGVRPCERCIVRISSELPDTVYVLGLTYEGARLWWYFGCYFCLPTLFTIGSSLATARKIRQAERACVRGNKKQIRLESQMNCTVVALAILYGLCVVPENIFNIVSAYMAAGIPRRSMDLLHLISQLLLFCKSAVTPVLLLCLCRPFGRAVLDCCCCCGAARSSAGASDDNDHECTTELELSPFSTIRREMSAYTAVGTHC